MFWSLALIWLISNRLYQTDCELNHTELARTPLTRSAGYEELAEWNFKYIVEIYLHIMACAHGCLRSAVFLLPFLLDCSTNVANESIASKPSLDARILFYVVRLVLVGKKGAK